MPSCAFGAFAELSTCNCVDVRIGLPRHSDLVIASRYLHQDLRAEQAAGGTGRRVPRCSTRLADDVKPHEALAPNEQARSVARFRATRRRRRTTSEMGQEQALCRLRRGASPR